VRKDGTLGKEIVVPELDAIQRYALSAAALLHHKCTTLTASRGEAGMEALHNWIYYSTYDTRGTYELR
jgi:hypothetical protein